MKNLKSTKKSSKQAAVEYMNYLDKKFDWLENVLKDINIQKLDRILINHTNKNVYLNTKN